jgi:D-sedoheptulose 7-phosphate isomerase
MEAIRKAFLEHIEIAKATLDTLCPRIEQAGALMIKSFQAGGKAVLFGNGGSSTDALHVEGELLGRFRKDRRGLPAVALGGGIAAITAIANDYSFEQVFARLARAHIKPGDVVLALSTSGNSPNIVEAAKAARDLGASLIGFTGRDGGKLKDLVDILIDIPSEDTARIQEAHITVCHILCDLVEQAMFPDA